MKLFILTIFIFISDISAIDFIVHKQLTPTLRIIFREDSYVWQTLIHQKNGKSKWIDNIMN